MREKILIADDEESIRFTFSEFLSGAGYQVNTAATLAECLNLLDREPFDLVFLDIRIGDEDGLGALQGIRHRHPACQVVIMTGNPHPRTIIEARQSGAIDHLAKPIRQTSLLYIARKVLDLHADATNLHPPPCND